MVYKEIYENNESFTAFPDQDDIFATEFEKELLIPLGIYHLSDNHGTHDILLAAPLGDEEGMIGKKNIGEFCGETWLTYSKRNGKWALDCSPDDLLSFKYNSAKTQASYSEQKEVFKQNGFLLNQNSGNKFPLFIEGDSVSGGYNWCANIQGCISYRLDSAEGNRQQITLFDENGNEYQFLGIAYSCNYARLLLADIYFFFNVACQRVLLIHEFS